MFATRREVTADAAELASPCGAAETAADLLLQLDHAQVTFGLVVVKGHPQVFQEPQHLRPLQPQARQQPAALFPERGTAVTRIVRFNFVGHLGDLFPHIRIRQVPQKEDRAHDAPQFTERQIG